MLSSPAERMNSVTAELGNACQDGKLYFVICIKVSGEL